MSQYPSSVPRSPRLSNMLGAAPVTSEDGALTPHHASDHPSPPPRGLALHPDLDAPPGWARPGPCPRPSENYIPPWARAVSPAELSSVPQDQASSPGGFTALGLEKKGAAGMDKLKLGPPGPSAALHPLPAFLIVSRAAAAHSFLLAPPPLLPLPAFLLPHRPAHGGSLSHARAAPSQRSSSPSSRQ